MITFITTGRDDDYGVGFLDRLHLSLNTNLQNIDKIGIEYEYLIVEWNPFRNYLSSHENFKPLFDKYNLVDIIVKDSVVKTEKLKPNIFYEYFAKNVGIRNSKNDVLVILNSDIIIPIETLKNLVDIVQNKFNSNYFYRVMNRIHVDDKLHEIRREVIHHPQNPDGIIAGYCAGDLMMINKQTLIEYGQGYDETNQHHRTITQTGMDGEILWNLHFKGKRVHIINKDYYHINHTHPNPRDMHYNMKGYENKPDWGFINYNKKIISDKLIEIG